MTTLREGSWPWADTKLYAENPYPLTWDYSLIYPSSDKERDFLEDYSRSEELAGHHSPPFGPDLLPGMYSTPVIAVPKAGSADEFRMCSHMSAGSYCQNSMMDRSETRGARLDTMHNFVAALLRYRRSHPNNRPVEV
jgi:hypothetical protein